MSVNKKLLEAKSNQELEEYIKPESKFVPEAKLYAYEILKARSREFSDEETARIVLLIEEENTRKNFTLHPNYKKSAELIYLAAVLGIGNMIWQYETLDSGRKFFTALLTLAFLFGLGYVVSRGIEWFKFILLVLLAFGLLGFPLMVSEFVNDPVVGVIYIAQTVLQVWSLILLFKIPEAVRTQQTD